MSNTYTVELLHPRTTFMCYKWSPGMDAPEAGYQVELYEYDDQNHRCSCDHGSHQKFEKGRTLVQCKHIKLVLEMVNKAWNELLEFGLISDNSITLKDLSGTEFGFIHEKIKDLK